MNGTTQTLGAKSVKLFSLWAVLLVPLQLMAADEPRKMVEIGRVSPLPVQFDEPPRPWINVTPPPAPAQQTSQIRDSTIANDTSAMNVGNPAPPAPEGDRK